MPTISQELARAQKQIERFDADILLGHIVGMPRTSLIAHGTDKLRFFDLIRFRHLVYKRTRHIPIAYLTGEKEFFGLSFLINKHTLVPRPDTEILVEAAAQQIQASTESGDRCTLIDVGTGSGCIPISILTSGIDIPTYATDRSHAALAIAKKNAVRHSADIRFLYGNLLAPFLRITKKNSAPCDTVVLTANLPYLTEAQFSEERSISREPKRALVADNGGLALYEQLLSQLHACPYKKLYGYFEIDPSQTGRITDAIHQAFPRASIQILKDYAGQERCVSFMLEA